MYLILFIQKFGGSNPTQNMFKMFTHISGVEYIYSSKSDMGILKLSPRLFYLIYNSGYRL